MAVNAPTNLTSSRISDTSIRLSWHSDGTGSEVHIDKMVDNGSWTVDVAYVLTNFAGDFTWTDSSSGAVSANHRYRYRIRAKSGSTYSSYTYSSYAYTTPRAPSSVVVGLKDDQKTVRAVIYLAANYHPNYLGLQRSADGGATWTSVATSITSDSEILCTYDDATYTGGSLLKYRARSVAGGLSSAWVMSDSVQTIGVPNPPSSCSATRKSDSSASVLWSNGTQDDIRPRTGTYVERQTDAGSWVQIASVAQNTSRYDDTTISANHRYRYRVRAFNNYGASSYSTSGYIYTTPAAPTAVKLTKTSANVVKVEATYSAPYATGVDVQRNEDSGGWAVVASSTSLPVNDTITGESVQYRVRTVRGTLASAWKTSSTISGLKPPNAPTITSKPNAVTSSGTVCTISWTPNHPDGSAQSQAQVLLTAPDSAQTTATLGAMTSHSFTPSSVGVWTAQVRTKGLHEDWGAWSSSIQWRMADLPIVTITSPAIDGEEIDNLPLVISWAVTDVSGVSSSTMTISGTSGDLYKRTFAGTPPDSVSLPRSALPLENEADYTITVDAVNGYGLSVTAVRTFTVSWDMPAEPTVTIERSDGASAAITVGDGEGSTVPTESITVQRINPDGTAWMVAEGLHSGDSCTDPLVPLGVDVTYRATAYAASGAASQHDVVHLIESSDWALNFRDDAGEWALMRYNPGSNYSMEHGGELYHFADGGEGGGLPVWYGTADRDESGSLRFGSDGGGDFDRLRALCMDYPVAWIRDPFGHRWRAHVRPSVSHDVGALWIEGVDWDAVRFREAW